MNIKGKKISRIKFSLITSTFLLLTMFYGCNKETEEVNKIQLKNGAIAIENLGEYEIYNLNNGKYEKMDIDYVIKSFDSKSNNYIFYEDEKFKINNLGKVISIEESKNVLSPKLSKGGIYVSYFVKDGYLDLIVKDIDKNRNINIDSKVSISGELIDWLNEDTLVYYGVDDNKNNGLFIYNLSEDKEELLYKLDSGYIEYLKVLDNGLVFLQEKEGKQKSLKFINENGEIRDSIENIVEASGVEVTPEGIFILGKMENNNYSLYEFTDGKIKRLVYDFPKIINLEKGLSKDSNGNILFVGGDDLSNEQIYICNDGVISLLDTENGDHYFIDYN